MSADYGTHVTALRARARRKNKPKKRDTRARDKRETRNAHSKRTRD